MSRLPDGFAVQVDRRVRTLGSGSALRGGSPTRLLRLAPAARTMLRDGRLEVRDDLSAELARTLLDTGVAHPRPAGGPSYRDVTVVIPVRDNPSGLHRLVMSLRGMAVVIVDDASATPVDPRDFDGAPCEIEIVRHSASLGPAAARNSGLGRCRTEFVTFLDSDVLPRRGWLEALLGHFCDPAVALVAPRIVAMHPGQTAVGRYEAARSSLDLGHREAPVLPYSPVSYVPSAAIVCRRSVVLGVGGFDEALHSGEDVDLCWRLVESGSRLRYEPVALVAHDHRTELAGWLSRRAFYGGSAAPLALRHPDNAAPLVMSLWVLLAWVSVATGSRAGAAAGTVFAGLHARRVAAALANSDAGARDVIVLAARGLGHGALPLSSAVSRPYWPLALTVAALSRRGRRMVAAAALIDAAADRLRRRPVPEGAGEPIGPLGQMLFKRLDDVAYGAGLWAGVVRERTLHPLRPDIRR
ncbi:MAG: mycofactocin biosynthesis glycosyltransferase MftF [Mycobacterium sp.]